MPNTDLAVSTRKARVKIADEWLRQVLSLLYQRRNLTRSEIIESTGVNPASVSHALRYLLNRGILLRVGQFRGVRGRWREAFNLNAEAGYFVAVDLEGDRIRFALTNFIGDVRCRWEEYLEFRQALPVRSVINGIGKLLRELDERQLSRVLAVGVSYPGLLDADGCLSAGNLGWKKFPLQKILKEAFSWPLFLEQDKHTCVLAESWLGAAQKYGNALFLIAEGGIGLGIMVDRRPLQGARGFSGEIGHWKIFPDAKDLCNCGQEGCLEAIASAPNIVRQYKELSRGAAADIEGLRMADVVQKARQQDPLAQAVLERAGRALGLALSHAISLLNPEIVILGGDLIGAEDVLLPIIDNEIQRKTLSNSLRGVRIITSGLGLDIRLKGAASLAFRKMLDDSVLLKEMCSPAVQARRNRAFEPQS